MILTVTCMQSKTYLGLSLIIISGYILDFIIVLCNMTMCILHTDSLMSRSHLELS